MAGVPGGDRALVSVHRHQGLDQDMDRRERTEGRKVQATTVGRSGVCLCSRDYRVARRRSPGGTTKEGQPRVMVVTTRAILSSATAPIASRATVMARAGSPCKWCRTAPGTAPMTRAHMKTSEGTNPRARRPWNEFS